MTTTKTITALCVTCGREFTVEQRSGRKPRTCSDKCRNTRNTRNKRATRKQAKRGDPEYPWNHRRPNVSGDQTYKPMTERELSEYVSQGVALWERHKLRGTSPDIDLDGWEITETEKIPDEEEDATPWSIIESPTAVGTFVMDDYFDVQAKPLALIPQSRQAQASAWLARNRFESGWEVGRTSKYHIGVIGSDKPIKRVLPPHQLREQFYPTMPFEDTTGQLYLKPMKPFVTVFAG
jgi:hypothetical protein